MSAPRRRSGEIGIRTRLKIWRGHTHVGSSPTSGTNSSRTQLSVNSPVGSPRGGCSLRVGQGSGMTHHEKLHKHGILRHGTPRTGFRYVHSDGKKTASGEVARI